MDCVRGFNSMSMVCKLDWLSFTWKSGNQFSVDEIYNFFKAFPEIENILVQSVIIRDSNIHGKYGKYYDHVLGFCDFFDVSYNLHDFDEDSEQYGVNMGVNVSVPAHGLEFFFDLFGFKCDQVVEMLQMLRERGCKFSRLDFAFDDFDKTFTPKDFTRWGVNDQIVSKMKRIDHKQSAKDTGWTFYMGTRDNGKYLRIYDKAYQSKGLINAIRYEFELHSKYTASVVDWILDHQEAPRFTELLSWFIMRIVQQGYNSDNRAHADTLPEWNDFIEIHESLLSRVDDEQPLQIVATKADECCNDVFRFMRYLKKQVGRKLCALRHTMDADRFNDLLDSLEDEQANDEFCSYWNHHKKEIETSLFDHNGDLLKDWQSNIFKVS